MLPWTVLLLLSEGIIFPDCHGIRHTVKTSAPSLQPVTPRLHLSAVSKSPPSLCHPMLPTSSIIFIIQHVFSSLFQQRWPGY